MYAADHRIIYGKEFVITAIIKYVDMLRRKVCIILGEEVFLLSMLSCSTHV